MIYATRRAFSHTGPARKVWPMPRTPPGWPDNSKGWKERERKSSAMEPKQLKRETRPIREICLKRPTLVQELAVAPLCGQWAQRRASHARSATRVESAARSTAHQPDGRADGTRGAVHISGHQASMALQAVGCRRQHGSRPTTGGTAALHMCARLLCM